MVEVPDMKHYENTGDGSSTVPCRPHTDIMRATVTFHSSFANVCINTILIFILQASVPCVWMIYKKRVLSKTHTAWFPAAQISGPTYLLVILLFYFTVVETYYFSTYSLFISYNLQLHSHNQQGKFQCHVQCSVDSTVTVDKNAMLVNIKIYTYRKWCRNITTL
jgi:hypothetical protein